MSLPERVIRPTPAEHVREGDWVLAAWEGTLGIWRVTGRLPGHDRANDAAVHLTVSLTLVRINSSGERIEQLHRWDALVPVLVPLPEPETVALEAHTIEPQRVVVEVCGCGWCARHRPDERKPCQPTPVDRGDGVVLWPCRHCQTQDWKLRCPHR